MAANWVSLFIGCLQWTNMATPRYMCGKFFFHKMKSKRFVCTSEILCKVNPKNIKGKDVTAQNWLRRQLNDPYVKRSAVENYRCRSAFKLIEIDEKYHIFRSGQVVIDIGAAPGSWTQVAVKRVNSFPIGISNDILISKCLHKYLSLNVFCQTKFSLAIRRWPICLVKPVLPLAPPKKTKHASSRQRPRGRMRDQLVSAVPSPPPTNCQAFSVAAWKAEQQRPKAKRNPSNSQLLGFCSS